MDLVFSAEELAFRDEVREFLRTHLPDDIRETTRRNPSYIDREMMVRWQKILYEQGWIAPAWPKEYGGTGWNLVQRYLFDEEYQAADCPRVSPFGLMMVGPVLYTFGTPAQKERYLPKILSSEHLWCQGYSERGSGSDLASLQTRAAPDGDDYVINGHKIWTSHAHHADMIFCLTRTNSEGKRQEGITFLLIPMNTPGITVRPIISIDQNHYLNEVFFDDVRVPAENRIGEENKGWTYAKFLLGHERTGVAGVSKSKRKVERLHEVATAESDGGRPLIEDAGFARRLADIETRLMALEFTQLRLLARDRDGETSGGEPSMLKIRGSEIEQDLNEAAIEAIGYYAGPYPNEAPRPEANAPGIGLDHAEGKMAEHLLRRAATIYGGSNEIQRGIIAKMVLGL